MNKLAEVKKRIDDFINNKRAPEELEAMGVDDVVDYMIARKEVGREVYQLMINLAQKDERKEDYRYLMKNVPDLMRYFREFESLFLKGHPVSLPMCISERMGMAAILEESGYIPSEDGNERYSATQ